MTTSERDPLSVELLLVRQRRRIGASIFLRALARGLPVALLAAALGLGLTPWLSLVAGETRGPLRVAAWLLLAGAVLAVLVAGVVAWWRTPSPARVALELDRRLGTRELLIAACEAGPATDHPLQLEARRRARERLALPGTRRLLPLTAPRRWVATAGGVLALLLASLVPGPPEVAAGPPDPELAAAGESLERKLDALAAEGLPFGEGDEGDAPFERLRDLAADLQQGTIAEKRDALLALEQIEQALEAAKLATDRGTEGGPRSAGLAPVLEELSADPYGGEVAEALREGDAEALHESLRRLADALPPDRMAAEGRAQELADLADRLGELAERMRMMGLAEEAAALDELAEAIRAGDMERARELIEQLAAAPGACSRMAASADEARAAREMLEAVNLARYLLGLGEPPKLAQGQGEQGDSPGGPHPGTTSTNREAEGHATGERVVRDRRSDELSERSEAYEELYDSHIIEAESWVDAKARGRLGESGQMFSETGRALGTETDSELPPGAFAAAAPGAEQRAAELERVPLGYRDLVRRYFTRDDPAAASVSETQAEGPAGGPASSGQAAERKDESGGG